MDPKVKIWPVERTNKDGLREGAWYIHTYRSPPGSQYTAWTLWVAPVGLYLEHCAVWLLPEGHQTLPSLKRETHTRMSYIDYVRVHICYSGFKNPVDKGSSFVDKRKLGNFVCFSIPNGRQLSTNTVLSIADCQECMEWRSAYWWLNKKGVGHWPSTN